jgi:hypothetical protein
MNKLFALIVLMITLPGCSSFSLFGRSQPPEPLPLPPVKIITETVQLEIYQPPLPPEIQLDDVQWFVLTESNMQDKVAEVKRFTGAEFVVFGLTPQSYENMAYNLQEIRRYIRQQTEIIKYYREATKVKGSDGWLEENEEQQNTQVEIEQSNNETTETSAAPTVPEETGLFRRLIPNIGN